MRRTPCGWNPSPKCYNFMGILRETKVFKDTDCHNQCAHWFRNDTLDRGCVRKLNFHLQHHYFHSVSQAHLDDLSLLRCLRSALLSRHFAAVYEEQRPSSAELPKKGAVFLSITVQR